MKSQSAMEYLMTYRWAILIIAVVLAVLFQLGVFSGSNYGNTATAGSCQVETTSSGSSLVGECQGLQPKFVAVFNGAGNVIVPEISQYAITGPISMTAWVNWKNVPASTNIGIVAPGPTGGHDFPLLFAQASAPDFYQFAVYNGVTELAAPGPTVTTGTWVFVAGTFSQNPTVVTLYLNGSQVGQNSKSGIFVQAQYGNGWSFGSSAGLGTFASYSLSNVQIYNTTLTAAEVLALYQEGIGGAPVRPQNLVGWWPLNGNPNDYSGNNNNGATTNIGYSSSWQSGYTAP